VPHFLSFWKKWKSIGGDVNFGTTGVSHGIQYDGSRIGLFFFYDTNFYLLKQSRVEKYGISTKSYSAYKDHLKRNYQKAYDMLISGKAMMLYDGMLEEELHIMFDAMLKMAELLKQEE
jgi:hypothetical protein